MKPYINLDFYAEGNAGFKRKLAGLLILSVQELQQSLKDSLTKKNPEIFKKACHKEKTTLIILGNSDFLRLTTDINESLSSNQGGQLSEKQLKLFHNFCTQAVIELEKEV